MNKQSTADHNSRAQLRQYSRAIDAYTEAMRRDDRVIKDGLHYASGVTSRELAFWTLKLIAYEQARRQGS